jgi:hypothetical protein
VFRRSNPGWLVPTLTGVAGFVAGTYAEAEFGLSKQFTRGGLATAGAAREAATAVRERRLPELPKAKKPARFEPSDRLARMYLAFDVAEGKKKRIPFAEAERRAAAEAQLDAMWAQIESLRAKEEAAWKATKSNPRKLPVPEHVAKTPRKAGERISAIGVKGKWPIGDLFHARLAAIYILSPSHSAKKAQVLRALETNWPQYDWRGFLSQRGTLRQVANPALSVGQTFEVGYTAYTVVRVLPDAVIVSRQGKRGDGDDLYRLMGVSTEADLLRELSDHEGRRIKNPLLPSLREVLLAGKELSRHRLVIEEGYGPFRRFSGYEVRAENRDFYDRVTPETVIRFPSENTVEIYRVLRATRVPELLGTLRLRPGSSPQEGAAAVAKTLWYMCRTGYGPEGYRLPMAAQYSDVSKYFDEIGYEPSRSAW